MTGQGSVRRGRGEASRSGLPPPLAGASGNITITNVLLLMAFLMLVMILFNIYGVYFAKRSGQTAADAAALAAIRYVEQNFKETIRSMLDVRLDELRQALLAADSDPHNPFTEAQKIAFIAAWLHKRNPDADPYAQPVASALVKGGSLDEPALLMAFFSRPERRGIALSASQGMEGEARSYAEENGARLVTVEFPYQCKPTAYVTVRRTSNMLILAEYLPSSQRQVHVDASATSRYLEKLQVSFC